MMSKKIVQDQSFLSVSTPDLPAVTQIKVAAAGQTEYIIAKKIRTERKIAILDKFSNKEYRQSYMKSTVLNGVAHQIRLNREYRGLTQQSFATLCGGKVRQTTISRFESASYGKLSINSILKIALALDVAVIVKFVSYRKFIDEYEDKSVGNLVVDSFHEITEQNTTFSYSNYKIGANISDNHMSGMIFGIINSEISPRYEPSQPTPKQITQW